MSGQQSITPLLQTKERPFDCMEESRNVERLRRVLRVEVNTYVFQDTAFEGVKRVRECG